MKKRLLACMATIMLLCAYNSSNAQITGVTVTAFDSVSSMCSVPIQGAVNYWGSVSGNPASTDSVDVYINFGDGFDTTIREPLSQKSFFGYVNHVYSLPGTFYTYIIATAFNGLADTLQTSTFTLTNTCASLSGSVFQDTDADGIFDATETGIPYIQVKCTNTTTNAIIYAFTDASGQYSASLPVGFSYTVVPQASYYNLVPTIPSSGSATVPIMTSTAVTQNFGFDCAASGWDAAVYGWAWSWRPGFTRPLSIVGTNNNFCNNVPATITLTLPPELTYSSAAPHTGTVSGNTVTWNVSSISAWLNWWNTVDLMCATTANIGDTLCITLNIVTTPADGNPTNNTYTLCAEVNNSYDPNDKQVAPRGWGQNGNILNGTPLTYVVNFQNTGNDVAYNVTISDQIDSDLDYNTLQLLSASHPVTVHRAENNMVKFRFANINLPDSNSNEPASHGHDVYTIKPKSNLPLGTQIHNTAKIYFDYNEAIITNTTLNTISAPQSVQHISSGSMEASIFPNPANGNLYVEVKDQANFKAELYDMIGRSVRVIEGRNGKTVINVKELSAGMYMLKLTNGANKVLSTKISVQH